MSPEQRGAVRVTVVADAHAVPRQLPESFLHAAGLAMPDGVAGRAGSAGLHFLPSANIARRIADRGVLPIGVGAV